MDTSPTDTERSPVGAPGGGDADSLSAVADRLRAHLREFTALQDELRSAPDRAAMRGAPGLPRTGRGRPAEWLRKLAWPLAAILVSAVVGLLFALVPEL